MGTMTYYYALGDLFPTTTTSTSTTTTTTTTATPITTTTSPPTPAKPLPPQPTNKPWTIASLLIDQFDAEYNNERYTTTLLDPCNVTKYDLGLPFGLFADRFLQSSHAPVCQPYQPCQPPPKQNIWWRSLQQFVRRVVFLSSTNDTNNDDDDATNRMIPRQDLFGAVKNWRSDEVVAMKRWAYERTTFQRYWSSSSTSSSANKEEQQEKKTFTEKVKEATDKKAIRGWIIVLLKRFTTIPPFVWYVISFTELMWSWRYLFTQVLPLVRQVYTASTMTVGLPLLLIWKASRALNIPHKLLQMAFPQMFMAYRLGKLAWNLLRAYWFYKECRDAVRQVRGIRTTTDFFRVMSSLVMRKIVRALGSSLCEVLLMVAGIMFTQAFWFGGFGGGGSGGGGGSYESHQQQGPSMLGTTTTTSTTTAEAGLDSWLVYLLKGVVTTAAFVVAAVLVVVVVARTWMSRQLYKRKMFLGAYGRQYSCEDRDIAERVLQAARGGGPGLHYRVLAVDPSAHPDQIRAAYRQLSHQLHNERNAAPGAAAAFGVVHVAMATLLDEAKRTAYDRREHRVDQHHLHHRPAAVPPPEPDGPSLIQMVGTVLVVFWAIVLMKLYCMAVASGR
jgi:DnaJ domain